MLMKEGGKVEEELVYNASPKSFDKLGERTGLIYLATNKREAKAYADMNRGNVKNIYINKNQVASEKDLISTMEELGINTTEGSVYELIDPRFDNFYIGKDAMNKVTNALAEKGFKAAKYEDGAQVVSGKVESIVVFDKSIKPGDLMTGSMPAEESAKWFGVAPPDLTLVSRYKGDDWIYSYLRAYYEDSSKQYGVNNLVYPGTAMPNVLLSLQGNQRLVCKNIPQIAQNGGEKRDNLGNTIFKEKCGYLEVEEGTGLLSKQEFDNLIYDLTNFLVYVGAVSYTHLTLPTKRIV